MWSKCICFRTRRGRTLVKDWVTSSLGLGTLSAGHGECAPNHQPGAGEGRGRKKNPSDLKAPVGPGHSGAAGSDAPPPGSTTSQGPLHSPRDCEGRWSKVVATKQRTAGECPRARPPRVFGAAGGSGVCRGADGCVGRAAESGWVRAGRPRRTPAHLAHWPGCTALCRPGPSLWSHRNCRRTCASPPPGRLRGPLRG